MASTCVKLLFLMSCLLAESSAIFNDPKTSQENGVDVTATEICPLQLTCSDCMFAHAACAWCKETDYAKSGEDRNRCDIVANLKLRGCYEIENHDHEEIENTVSMIFL